MSLLYFIITQKLLHQSNSPACQHAAPMQLLYLLPHLILIPPNIGVEEGKVVAIHCLRFKLRYAVQELQPWAFTRPKIYHCPASGLKM